MPGLYRWAVNDHKSQRFFVPRYALSIRVPCEQSVHYHNLENRPHFTDNPRGKGMAHGCTAEAWRSWESKERCLLSKPRAANPPLRWRFPLAHSTQQEWTSVEETNDCVISVSWFHGSGRFRSGAFAGQMSTTLFRLAHRTSAHITLKIIIIKLRHRNIGTFPVKSQISCVIGKIGKSGNVRPT